MKPSPPADLAGPPLDLLYQGRVFPVPPVTIAAGAELMRIHSADGPPAGLDWGRALRLALGAADDELRAANVPVAMFDRAGETALIYFLSGPERAAEVWAGRDLADGPASSAPPAEGMALLEEYGRGDRDPETGLYEWYEDLPPEAGPQAAEFSWVRVLDVLPLVEYDFAAVLGVDLEDVWHVRSWRWFATRVIGLLAAEGMLAAHFRPGEPPTPDPEAAASPE